MNQAVIATTAAIILQYLDGALHVMLIADGHYDQAPTQWKLPSTTIAGGQTSFSSLEHYLRQAVGFHARDIHYKEQLYTMEYAIEQQSILCVSYLYLSRGIGWYKGAQSSRVFPIDKLPRLNKSDTTLLRYALDRLHAKTLYSTILTFLLPETFTLTDLQQAFETVTKQSVDRRNFRKKMLALDVLTAEHSAPSAGEAHRYHFTDTDHLAFLTKPFSPK